MNQAMRTAVICVGGLSRRYGPTRALDEVELTLQGGITGLLGPNGAGKTTLLSILATVNEADAGRVSVFGLNPGDTTERTEIRRRLGYLPQELGYHRHFTVAGFLDYVAILKEITERRVRAQEVARVLAAVGLPGDPVVVLSTHQADDIAAICPQVVVLLQGRVRFAGTPSELAATAAGRVWAADQRDERAHLSWRGGDGRWRHIGDQPPAGAEPVTPTVEDGYLMLSHAAGSR